MAVPVAIGIPTDPVKRAMYERLLKMRAGLPMKYQQLIQEDRLASLANCASETVFSILAEMHEIQNRTEKDLFRARQAFVGKQRDEKEELVRKLKAESVAGTSAAAKMLNKSHEIRIRELDREQRKALTRYDAWIVRQFDQQVAEQQTTLQQAGLPGFFLTGEGDEVKVQMILLKFLLKLNSEIKSFRAS